MYAPIVLKRESLRDVQAEIPESSMSEFMLLLLHRVDTSNSAAI